MITLGGSAAGLLISGQPLLRPWLPLAALLPAFSVCVCLCVYTSSVVEPVCIHSIFVPSVCASDLFPALAVPSIRRAWLSSACQPAACEVLARRLSFSPLLCQLLSLPLSARVQKTPKKQFNVRLTFRRAFHRSPLPLARFHPGFFFFFSQFETEVLRPIAIDCLACKTAQLIEKAVSLL